MTTKHTRWFPGDVQPARPGVYERNWPGGNGYAMWDGTHWRTSWGTPAMAANPQRAVSGMQGRIRWRGLTGSAA